LLGGVVVIAYIFFRARHPHVQMTMLVHGAAGIAVDPL